MHATGFSGRKAFILHKVGDFAAASQNYEKALMLNARSMKSYIYDKLAYDHFMQKQCTLTLGAIKKTLQHALPQTTSR